MPIFYGAIDLSKNELRNAVIQNLGSPPAGQKGQIYFDSTANVLYWHNGTTWVSASGASPATTVAAEVIGATAIVGTAVTYAREDHRHALTGPAVAALDMGGFAINSLPTPVAAAEAANKSYVDSLVNGLSWKAPVRAYGAANITLSGVPSSGLTDGVTLVVGDRVLLNNQSSPPQNGIYVVASGAWARATDNDNAAEMANATVYISEGTTYADTQWTCTTNAPITVGTTNIAFQQIAGAGTYSWGQGLTNVGNTVNVNPGTGITIVADAVTVDQTVIAPVARSINTTAPLTGGGNLSADRTLAINNFAGSTPGAVPTSPGGSTTFLRADGTWSTPAGGVGKYSAALAGNVIYATGEVVNHNLNTRDVQVTVVNGSTPYQAVEVDWEATSVNTVTLRYNPNTLTGYRVVVVG